MIDRVIYAMEKTGNITFDSDYERYSFAKLAQNMLDPMTMQMMAQQAGMPMPQDPSMLQVPQQQAMAPGMMAGPGAQIPPQGAMPTDMAAESIGPSAGQEETMIGESITNKDIESLVKIINVLTSLKTKYDSIKNEQMTMLKDQQQMPSGAGPQV